MTRVVRGIGLGLWPRRIDDKGYSLVEVLVAAGLLALGIAAAAMLGMTMISQQEANARVVRALNYQEQASRLYQLGLDPSVITNILPLESGVVSLDFATNSVVAATTNGTEVGTVNMATCTLVYDGGSMLISGGSAAEQTNETVVVRPSIR